MSGLLSAKLHRRNNCGRLKSGPKPSALYFARSACTEHWRSDPAMASMTQRSEMEPLLSGNSADLAEIGVGDAAEVHVHVTFRSIYFRVVTREDTTLEILKNVSGHCLPGRVLSIMGPSGAGKTTLVGVRGHHLIVH